MNVQLQGVYVYCGDPQHHFVFRGQEFRKRRCRILKVACAVVLALVFVWCIHAAVTTIAEPPEAKADTDMTAMAMPDTQIQQTDTTVSSS